MAQGPQFVQYFGPVLDALRELGGSGTPNHVRDQLTSKLAISEQVQKEQLPGGGSRFDNQVAWARFYLVKAGFIDASRRGIWSLTDEGKAAHLDEDAALRLFKDIHLGFKAPLAPDPDASALTGGPSLEGYDEAYGLGDYPIDALLIRSEQRTVHDVVRRISQGVYVMDPDFQRDFVWSPDRQSRLIESLLLRIPLPVIYLAEDADGKLVVVDGLQRLTTFRNFLTNQLKLNLENPNLLGKKFSDLPAKLQNRIEDAQLIIYLIDSKVPERARLEIFERVNSGVPLTRQQMRNSLYQGKGTALLRVLADEQLFLDATDRGLDRQSMRDREAINRFCAFRLLGVDKYRDEMDGFLAESLRRLNRMTAAEVTEVGDAFRRSMRNNVAVFGEHAFRKHQPQQSRRSVINMSLFDVTSVGLARYTEAVVEQNKDALHEGFFGLMTDAQFDDSITYGTSDRLKVVTRFAKFGKLLEGVLGAP